MLLIFFLVTTTMDVDSGLERRLPQMPPDQEEPDDTPPIKERNVFAVLVNTNNQLMVEGEPMRVDDLREKAKEFLENPANDINLPEKKVEYVEFFGEIEIPKQPVISLRNDLGTQYGVYLRVQNELVAAINELRDKFAKKQFGKPYSALEKAEQNAIRKIVPMKISEAEPKNVGGK